MEGRFVGCEESTDLCVTGVATRWGSEAGAPLEVDDLQSSGWKGGRALTIWVGDFPKRPPSPDRVVSGSDAEDGTTNQHAVSHLSALRHHEQEAEIHFKGYMILR
jgi:hypothetical protein